MRLGPLDNRCIWGNNRLCFESLYDCSYGKKFFSSFFIREIVKVHLPITKITQIRSSKSMGKPEEWTSIADFGKSVYDRNDISTRDDIERLVQHVLSKDNPINVTHHDWSGEYLWNNTDGSHHFGIAYFHSINSNPIEIPVKLTTISFDKNAYFTRLGNNSLWITHDHNFRDIISDLNWKLNFDVQEFEYPMKETPNVIIKVTNDTFGLKEVFKDFPNFIIPFEHLFMKRAGNNLKPLFMNC